MSTRVVVIALAIAVLLGVVAIFLTRTPQPITGPAIPPGELVVRMAPSSVERIELRPAAGGVGAGAQGGVQDLTQHDGNWSLKLAEDGIEWPVANAQVSSFLRYVAATRSLGPPSAAEEQPGREVRFHLTNGEVISLTFAARQLAGQVAVRVKRPGEDGEDVERTALIEDDLLRAIEPPSGPPSWRATEAIRMVPGDVSRITLANDQGRLSIARTGRTWRLLLPVAAPAEEPQVERLLRSAGALRITDFLDRGVPATRETGLDTPVATLIVEADRREIVEDDQVVVTTQAREVIVGGPADATGVSLFAKIGPEGAVVVINASTLTALTVAPEPYVRRAPIGASPADVAGLRLDAPLSAGVDAGMQDPSSAWLHYEKTLEGWAQHGIADKPSLLDAATRSAIDDVITHLAGGATVDVKLARPDTYTPMARLHIDGLAGQPLEEIEIGVAGTDDAQAIVLRSDHVYRIETGELPPFFRRFLEEALLRASSAEDATPPPQPEGPEIYK